MKDHIISHMAMMPRMRYEELATSDDENKGDNDEKKADENFRRIWRNFKKNQQIKNAH
jgi:hypothetical protein